MVSYAEELGRNEGEREDGGEVDEGINCLWADTVGQYVTAVIHGLCANVAHMDMCVWI